MMLVQAGAADGGRYDVDEAVWYGSAGLHKFGSGVNT